MLTVTDDITGEVFYVIGQRLINKNTPIVKGAVPRAPIVYLRKRFGFISKNPYTEYILTVCSFACPDELELDYYMDALKYDVPDISACQILHDMLYDPDSVLLCKVRDVYLNFTSKSTNDLPTVNNSVPCGLDWWVGGFTYKNAHHLRIGTNVLRTDDDSLRMPMRSTYNAMRSISRQSNLCSDTLGESEVLCMYSGVCPVEVMSKSDLQQYVDALNMYEEKYRDYYPASIYCVMNIHNDCSLNCRSIGEILSKQTTMVYRIACTIFGLRGRSMLEDMLIKWIYEMPIDKQYESMTPFFNHILGSKNISVCSKELILNVALGPCIFGGKLPKRFLNVNKSLRNVSGVRYLEIDKDFTYEDVKMLSNMHTGIKRKLTYQGLVAFMLDKTLHDKFPEEHSEIVNTIKECSSSFVNNDIDDVYKLLNLGSRPIPATRPSGKLSNVLEKEKDWTYAHGCLYTYEQNGNSIELEGCEEKTEFKSYELLLSYIILGSYTGISNVKLYRWLCKLVSKNVMPYAQGGCPDDCVRRWLQSLHNGMSTSNELLYWIFRYKEELPTCIDSYITGTDENLVI